MSLRRRIYILDRVKTDKQLKLHKLTTAIHCAFVDLANPRRSNLLFRGDPFRTPTRRGDGGQAQVDLGRGPAPCGHPHRKLKLGSTDVILSSSHAKKLASFLPEFRLWTEKSVHFSAI